jgi:hypothetical protein
MRQRQRQYIRTGLDRAAWIMKYYILICRRVIRWFAIWSSKVSRVLHILAQSYGG